MDITEAEINAPWGIISVKLWGDADDPAILTIHGIMDNAGSFDGIIPLLPQNYFYICVDLPGHGKSSHFPPHLPIHTIDYIIVYKLVMDYFKREQYIIMAHSYGGQIGYLYAQLYPEKIEKLIMFDTVHMLPVPSNHFKHYLEDKFFNYFKMEEKKQLSNAPQYTYEEAFNRVMMGRPNLPTEKSAKALLARMLILKENGKYEFSLDQRLKYFINPLHDSRYVLETFKEHSVKCPILIIFGRDTSSYRTFVRPILNALKAHKNVTIKYVSGHHDVHQTDPERVAPFVKQFLRSQKSKL